jgi:hypothetical protein
LIVVSSPIVNVATRRQRKRAGDCRAGEKGKRETGLATEMPRRTQQTKLRVQMTRRKHGSLSRTRSPIHQYFVCGAFPGKIVERRFDAAFPPYYIVNLEIKSP